MGALTRREHMFSWRPWELRREPIIDIVGCEGLRLVVAIMPTFIFILPRIIFKTDFRWITDFSRFYYNTLSYGIDDFRKILIDFKEIRTSVSNFNIKNLHDILSYLLQFSVISIISFGTTITKVLSNYLVLKHVCSLCDYFQLKIGKSFSKVSQHNLMNLKDLKEGSGFILFKNFSNKFLKSSKLFGRDFKEIGLGKVKSFLNLYKPALYDLNSNNFFKRIIGSGGFNMGLSVTNLILSILNKNILLKNSEYWSKCNNILLFFNIYDIEFLKIVDKCMVTPLIIYFYKKINLYNLFYYIVLPARSFIETGGSFWIFTGKFFKSYKLGKFINVIFWDWFSSYSLKGFEYSLYSGEK